MTEAEVTFWQGSKLELKTVDTPSGSGTMLDTSLVRATQYMTDSN